MNPQARADLLMTEILEGFRAHEGRLSGALRPLVARVIELEDDLKHVKERLSNGIEPTLQKVCESVGQ